ncbi:hypothetical protein [Schlesneria sp. T3-172]|uniref:hypothetical protein n=1 Tax=Schlesneria TaxID=656899 RepID=UPI002EE5757F
MSDFNHEFLEIADIVPAFVPVDLQTAANNGQWVSMRNIGRLLCVLYKAAGTAGDDPVFTLRQATSNTGANAKPLSFTRVRTKIGAIGATLQWSLVTQSAANTYSPVSAASPALMAVDVTPTDLDLNNGFGFVQVQVPDTGTNAQLGAAFYIAYSVRFPQAELTSALS